MKLLLALSCLVCAALCARDWSAYSFNQFVKDYNRPYEAGTAEYALRENIFEENLREVLAHNAANLSYKMAINHLSDLTNEEYNTRLGYKKSLARKHGQFGAIHSEVPSVEDLPASVDWRKQGAVTPVKDQGHCGSCWSFSATETIESHWFIKTGQLQSLSEQQIASCTPNPHKCGGTGGCDGATFQLAFQAVADMGGLASEWSYAYNSYHGKNFDCAYNTTETPPAARVSSFVNIKRNDYNGLMAAVALKGPVAITVDASTWKQYAGGVFDGCNQKNPDINHGVQLVGYGTDPVHGDYWLVRNSWSPTWGEDGYIRLKRTSAVECGMDTTPQDGTACEGETDPVEVCGTCGILFDNAYPVV